MKATLLTLVTKNIMRKRISHKLVFEQKCQIWKLYHDGFSPQDIAEKFDISRITVYKIGKNEKYKN
jgi:predicted DNA-binding protein YlxM (UPF0122 family)